MTERNLSTEALWAHTEETIEREAAEREPFLKMFMATPEEAARRSMEDE